MTSPGRDTNPSLVRSQQTVVLYLLTSNNGKLSQLYSSVVKRIVNPLEVNWTMEPALISGFCSVKRMIVFRDLKQ